MPTFILGAGFNVDATAEAGPIFGEALYMGRYQIECGYRLVGDTLRLCFGLDVPPAGKSIEDLFADILARGNYGPLVKLADRLREADFSIASRLASGERLNCYRHFFDVFARSHFLTFNYDSLPETFLFRLGRWYPRDGFGLRIDAPTGRGRIRWQSIQHPGATPSREPVYPHIGVCHGAQAGAGAGEA
jgi:hypothetical protein